MAAVILVTNDDGVHAAGLDALAGALDELGEVYVVAPDREHSAVGHSLPLPRPRVRVEPATTLAAPRLSSPSSCEHPPLSDTPIPGDSLRS